MAVRDNLTKYDRYLLKSGDTMQGVLNAQNIYPSADNAYNLGAYNKGFLGVNARNYYSRLNQSNYSVIGIGQEGTESATGHAYISVGNATPKGTKGNSFGYINLYGTGKGATSLRPTNHNDSNIEIHLPNATGRLLRKEDFSYVDGVLTLNL